ncbi:MAG: hypothetical protein EXS37_20010 [Opitutus sp.]|nr:hypothetical protein [Opitutus sp.]
MKKLIMTLLTVGLLTLGATTASAQAEAKQKKKQKADSAMNSATAPKSVIHVVTVSFKEGTTPEQIKEAVAGVHKLPAKYPGITRVWTRTIKNQTEKTHIFVMEFASEQALKDYAGSDAQKEWYAVYEGIREQSATSDITN